MIRSAWPTSPARRATRRRPTSRTPISSSSTPAISASAPPRRSISELGKLRELKDDARAPGPRDHAGRGRLRRAGRRRGNPAPPTGRRSRRRTAELSPPAATAARPARAAAGAVDTEFPGRGQVRPSARRAGRGDPRARRQPPSSPCRRAATSSARSASCPTRAAARLRGRSPRSLAEIERLAARRRRRNHPDRPERQRLSRPRRERRASVSLADAARRARPKFPACCGCATRPPIPTT